VTKISGYIQPKRRYIACNWHSTMSYCVPVLWRRQDLVQGAAAVLGKKIFGGLALIIWEATSAKRNYYKTN